MGVLTLAMGQGVLTASLGPELPCSGHQRLEDLWAPSCFIYKARGSAGMTQPFLLNSVIPIRLCDFGLGNSSFTIFLPGKWDRDSSYLLYRQAIRTKLRFGYKDTLRKDKPLHGTRLPKSHLYLISLIIPNYVNLTFLN